MIVIIIELFDNGDADIRPCCEFTDMLIDNGEFYLDENGFGLYTNIDEIIKLNYCPNCGAEIMVFSRTNQQRMDELEERVKQLEKSIMFIDFGKFN